MKLLLTSVFRPFGVDDEFNRKDNPFEQMHSSITRSQGIFSIHTHNRSYGLTLLAENLKVPTTVLDFPTFDEFKNEVSKGYTHVGISFIVPAISKAEVMAKFIRNKHPEIKIFIGGHGAQISEIEKIVPCDEACRMEGISWLRMKMGEDAAAPIYHPAIPIEVWRKIMGIEMFTKKAVVVPGVGCASHCNFCSTSQYFQGYKSYLKGAKELFDTLVRVSDTLGVNDFWLLDENFLEDESRARELIELMEKSGRFFCFDMFSSLRALSRFSATDLVRLGTNFIWVGIETKAPIFKKNEGVDAKQLFAEVRRHGISILASSILFFDHHNRQNLPEDIDYTISLEPDFTQFTALCPAPGTILFHQLTKQGRILNEIPMLEWHGQNRIWFRHPVFSPDESKQITLSAFQKDYQTLGPSLFRYSRTKLEGYKTLKALNDPSLATRMKQCRFYAEEMRPMLYAFEKFAPNPSIAAKARALREDYRKEFGPMKFSDVLATIAVQGFARIEEGRVRRGLPARQPPTFIDRYRQ
ncbi:MAG: radical SAM protein [Candidatus Riflebacteria bacterium]|nr:radical SAM protein [Candidatus Riflebacteria bacterium]